MPGSSTLLLLARDEPYRAIASGLLSAALPQLRVACAQGPLEFAQELADADLTMVVISSELSWTTWQELMELLGSRHPDLPLVLWMSSPDPGAVIEGFRAGARDVVVRKEGDAIELRDRILALQGAGVVRAGASDDPWLDGLEAAQVPAFRWREANPRPSVTSALTRMLDGQRLDGDPLATLLEEELQSNIRAQLASSGRAHVKGARIPNSGDLWVDLRLVSADGSLWGVVQDTSEEHRLSIELSGVFGAADRAAAQVGEQEGEVRRLRRELEQLQLHTDGLAHDIVEPLLSAERRLSRVGDDLAQAGSLKARLALEAVANQLSSIADLARRQLRGEAQAPGPPTLVADVPEQADAHAVFTQVEANLVDALARSGATLSSGPLPRVAMPAVELLQILQNLVLNAVLHHKGPSPRIRVVAARQKQLWRFTVEDNGPGIPEAEMERIFEARWRGSGSAGSGVGLAVCRSLVSRHGGTIWVERGRAEGAAISFTVPAEADVSDLGEDDEGVDSSRDLPALA